MKVILIALLIASGQSIRWPEPVDNSPNFNQLSIANKQDPSTMETQSMQVVRDFLTAVQQGNQAKLAALIHPAIEWNQPGNNRFSGVKKSATDVFQMVGGMFQVSENSLALTDIKALTANGNSVACLVHWKATQPRGSVLDVDNIDVYTVEKGQIVKANIYSADIAQEDDFWLK